MRYALVLLALLAVLVWVSGYGPRVTYVLATPVATGVRWLATITTLTLVVDVPFMAVIWLTERLASRLLGARVSYRA